MRFSHLTVFRLHHQAPAAMQYPGPAQLGGSRAHAAVDPMARRFYGDQFYTSFIQEMVKSPCGITTTSHAGNHMRRQFISRRLLQLDPDLFADHTLEAGDHIRIGMGPHYATDNIMSVDRIVDPIPDRLIRGILQRLAAAYR